FLFREGTSTIEIYTLSLHDALPISPYVVIVGDAVEHRDALSWFETKPLFGWRVLVPRTKEQAGALSASLRRSGAVPEEVPTISRSEEHTSELQSRENLVCRLLLEKK